MNVDKNTEGGMEVAIQRFWNAFRIEISHYYQGKYFLCTYSGYLKLIIIFILWTTLTVFQIAAGKYDWLPQFIDYDMLTAGSC